MAVMLNSFFDISGNHSVESHLADLQSTDNRVLPYENLFTIEHAIFLGADECH
jgi:hypothetical protein